MNFPSATGASLPLKNLLAKAAFLGAAVTCATHSLHGATLTWSGATNTSVTTTTNWSPNGNPVNNTLVFGAAPNYNLSWNVAAASGIAGISFTNAATAGYTFTGTNNFTLTGGGITNTSAYAVRFANTTVTMSGSQTLGGGTAGLFLKQLDTAGSVTTTTGTILTEGLVSQAGGSLNVTSGTFTNSATVNSTSYTHAFLGALNVSSGATFTNNAVTNTQRLFGDGATVNLDGTFNQRGNIIILNNTLTLNALTGGATTGVFNLTNNAYLGGNGTATGVVEVGTGLTFNVAAGSKTNTYDGAINIAAGATFNHAGGDTAGSVFASSASLNIAGVYNQNTNAVVVNNSLNVNSLNGSTTGVFNLNVGVSGAGSINIGPGVTANGNVNFNNFTGTLSVGEGAAFHAYGAPVGGGTYFGSGGTLLIDGAYHAHVAKALTGAGYVSVGFTGELHLYSAQALSNSAFVEVLGGKLVLGPGLAGAQNVLTLGSGATLYFDGTLDLGGNYTAAGTYTLISGGTQDYDGVALSGFDSTNFAAAFSGGVLTLTAVPEPSVYGFAGAGALAAYSLVRRRRRARRIATV